MLRSATVSAVSERSDHFDLVVIGGGPGGYSAALYGASAGLNVALVEKDALGGTCLNRGCIPAKAFLETAAVKRHVDHAAEFGIETGAPEGSVAGVAFATTQARKQGIVKQLVGGIGSMCKGRNVEVFNGTGSLSAGRTVQVAMGDGGSATITGDFVMLASGSVPRLIPGFERGGPIMTSDEVLDLDTLPARVAVIGGARSVASSPPPPPTSAPRSRSSKASRRSSRVSTRTSRTSSSSRSRRRTSPSRPA